MSQRPSCLQWVPLMPLGAGLDIPFVLIFNDVWPGTLVAPFLTPRRLSSCSTLSPRKDCEAYKLRPIPNPFCLPVCLSAFPPKL